MLDQCNATLVALVQRQTINIHAVVHRLTAPACNAVHGCSGLPVHVGALALVHGCTLMMLNLAGLPPSTQQQPLPASTWYSHTYQNGMAGTACALLLLMAHCGQPLWDEQVVLQRPTYTQRWQRNVYSPWRWHI